MASIFLVRHGETDWNVSRRVMGRLDTPLNERGREQARALAPYIAALKIDVVYSSPQLRAVETAKLISGRPDVRIEPALSEVDYKRWEGAEWETLSKDPVYEAYRLDPANAKGEGFEAIPDVQRRMVEFAEGLAREKPEGRFVLVSHGDPLRSLASHLLNQELVNYRQFWFAHASLTALHYRQNRWVLSVFSFRAEPEIELAIF